MSIRENIALLTEGAGVSGAEEVMVRAEELLRKHAKDVRRDCFGSIMGSVGEGETHILLDAHLDRIGMVVTAVDETGFLRIDECGGTDPRLLTAAEVTIWGKKPIYGVVTSTPPHLAKEEDKGKAPKFDGIFVDTGMKYEELSELVRVGDRITFDAPVADLLGTRITGAALDDRIGIAAILRTLELLEEAEAKGAKLSMKVTALFSAQEEVGGSGARAAGFGLSPDEAIAVDVSFARAPGIKPTESGKLGDGVLICIAPILSNQMTEALVKLAEKHGIKHQFEVASRSTGTNADDIALTREGVRTGLLSIPLRNMHSQAEIIDLDDVEATAQLMAKYILSEGGRKDV